ncbi:restriction endonuclease subunit S [Pseudoalteromonas rhizosphaerae]|uniref:restriction endonuclease subunit S n=1 Tax=Pseudoalteromonas rhizosphaerae TaxID=2518973 RepID=UPI00385011A5
MENDFAIKNIPDNWELITLGELLDKEGGAVQTGPFGSQLHASDYVEKGIPSVMPKNITIEGINQDDIARITYEDAHRLKKYLLAKGDIVYSRRGDVEKCALVKNNESGWLCGTGCLRVRLGANSKLTPEYLHAYLSAPAIREWISRNAVGATMPNLNTGILKNVPLIVPTKKATQFIADAWLNINSKITLNKQTNHTLEKMAQALFKSWFVDFDPVFDNLLASVDFNLDNLEISLPDELKQKAQRRLAALNSLENAAEIKASLSALAHELQAQLPTKEATQAAVQVSEKAAETPVKANFNANPDILAQHANTHAHFPNEFVHNEQLGWIPKGWEKSQIQDLAKVVKGKSYKSAELSDSSTALVTLKSFKRGGGYRLDGLKGYTGKYKPEQEVFAGDLIVAYTDVTQAADVIGKPAMVISDTKYEHLVVSLDVAVVRCFNEIHKNYLYGVMKTDAFQNHSRSYTSGTTVLHLKKEAVPEYCLALPDNEILSAFLGVSAPLYEKIDRLIDENRALTKLRDTLLPKLISGELQIPDVATDEKAVD